MSLTEQQKKLCNCQRCNFELVEIEKDTIKQIIKILNPNFLSLPENYNAITFEWLKICPRCDNYPLGMDTEQGFPIRTRSGEITSINNLDFIAAHKHHHYWEEILNSRICGCFYCLETFRPDEIIEWHLEDESGIGQTALCPKCGIDSVIGSDSGYPIEHSFLKKMKDFWFSPSEWSKTMGASLG